MLATLTPWQNEPIWKTGVLLPPPAGSRRTGSGSPGSPRTTAIPPPTRRWPPTSWAAWWSRRAGCTTTSRRARRSSTGAVTGAIDRGVRQVVTGAAGYDGRALRYARPGVRWFEVDHPATQRDKLARLKRLGVAAPGVRFVEADFTRDPVADRLRAAGLDPDDAQPVPARRGGRLPRGRRPGERPGPVPPGRRARQPAGHQRVGVPPAATRCRARFQAAVAAMGEPVRSAFEAGQAEALLARTGWRSRTPAGKQAGGAPARGRPLTAPPACSDRAARPAGRPRPPPARPRRDPAVRRRPGQGPCRCRPCCPRHSWRSRSSSTTRPSTICRTAPPTTARPARATAPGWCRW